MTRPTVRIGGEVQGGGGGGGTCEPATAWDPTWTILYDRDFSGLADADVLPGGDGDVTIDGKTWGAQNVSKMDTLDVGSTHGGIKMGIDPAVAACQYHEGTFTGPALALNLAHLFEGTDFEQREDVEFRITSDLVTEGAAVSPVIEYYANMVRSPTWDTNVRAHTIRGGDNTNSAKFRSYGYGAGTLAYGDALLDNTDLAYFPNLHRFTWLENFLKFEHSPDALGAIGDEDLVQWLCYQRTADAQKLRKIAGDTKEAQFAFGYSKPSGGTGSITALVLKALRVEARLSPRGIGAFVP